jgi:hypothetical protein
MGQANMYGNVVASLQVRLQRLKLPSPAESVTATPGETPCDTRYPRISWHRQGTSQSTPVLSRNPPKQGAWVRRIDTGLNSPPPIPACPFSRAHQYLLRRGASVDFFFFPRRKFVARLRVLSHA